MLVDLILIISNRSFRRPVDPEPEVKEEGKGLDLTIFEELRIPAAHTVHFYSFDIFRGDQVSYHSPEREEGVPKASSLRSVAS